MILNVFQVWLTHAQELQFIWRIPPTLGSHIEQATLHKSVRLTWEEEHSTVEEERAHTYIVRILAVGKTASKQIISTDHIVQLPLAKGFELRGETIYYDRNILVNATRALFFMRNILKRQQQQQDNANIRIVPSSGNVFLLKRTR